MACSDVYQAGAIDHVIDVNDEMLVELDGRPCPWCGCRESCPVDGQEVADLPLRVCVDCKEVFGFDDSTLVPGRSKYEHTSCGGIWHSADEDETTGYPRPSSPCFRDTDAPAGDWSSPNEDEAVDRDHGQHHSEFPEPPRRGRGRGRGVCRGGCGHRRSSGHHQGDGRSHHHHHHHHHHHRGGGRGHTGHGSSQTAPTSCDPWKQVADTCLQSSKCALGVASHLAAGNYGGAVDTVSNEMEPIGRAVGSAIGSVTGDLISSPRAGEIGAEMGSTVGRGMAEMLKDSSICNRRSTSSQQD